MKNLETLKQKILDARDAYDKFILDNSRELTDDEKSEEEKLPTFIGVEQSESRMFTLTKDKAEEFGRLYNEIKKAEKRYIKAIRY